MLKRFTTLLLLLSCTLVTALEWIGNGRSITCIQVTTRNSVFQASSFNIFQEGPDDSWNIPPNVINTYCYIMWVNFMIFLKKKIEPGLRSPSPSSLQGASSARMWRDRGWAPTIQSLSD